MGLIQAKNLLGLPPDHLPSHSWCKKCSQKQTHKTIYIHVCIYVCISIFQVFNQNGEENSNLPLYHVDEGNAYDKIVQNEIKKYGGF